MSEFETVAKRYDKALSAQRDSQALVNQARGRFAAHLHGVESTPERSRRWILIPAFGMAAAIALTVALWPEAPLGVTVNGRAGTAELVESGTSEAVVDFSDGSEVRVREASQLRVLNVTAQGAQVALDRGSAKVSVVHRQKTKWVFMAGPYKVHVVGTQFELKWNPQTGGLAVEMDEGIVEVEGPGLARQRVTSRQKLEAFAEPASASLYLEAPPLPPETDTEPVVATGTPSRRRAPQPAPEKVVEKPPRPSGPSWRYLADKGDSRGAMNAAEQAGFEWLTQSMPTADVLELGDVALRAKRPAEAKQAWLAVRERFPATPGSAEAALRLGRLAADQRDVSGAGRWYGIAAKAPVGSTASQALGEWLELLVQAQRTDDARRVAGDYLKRFRNGPQSELARSVLGK